MSFITLQSAAVESALRRRTPGRYAPQVWATLTAAVLLACAAAKLL
jgi:hypothetical protein